MPPFTPVVYLPSNQLSMNYLKALLFLLVLKTLPCQQTILHLEPTRQPTVSRYDNQFHLSDLDKETVQSTQCVDWNPLPPLHWNVDTFVYNCSRLYSYFVFIPCIHTLYSFFVFIPCIHTLYSYFAFIPCIHTRLHAPACACVHLRAPACPACTCVRLPTSACACVRLRAPACACVRYIYIYIIYIASARATDRP